MRSSTVLAAAGMLFAASTVTAQYGADTVQGCYKSIAGFVLNQTFPHNTDGTCQRRCAPAGYNAMATTKGTDCWCGNVIPADTDKVDNSMCNVPCAGFGGAMCGGAKTWTVYVSGLVVPALVSTASASSSTSNAQSTTPGSSAVTTAAGGQTPTPTAGNQTTLPSPGSETSGANKAAIAAGVVVGIVLIAAIAGGIFIYLRNKKRREVEEEYRKNAAASSFITGGKPPASSGGDSFSDTRLDPSVAQRRMSDGSIADNQDYSRRILKVTNA